MLIPAYSSIGFIAIAVFFIINSDILFRKSESKEIRAYKTYLWSILVFYLSDVLWGYFEKYRLSTLLYYDTLFFYISMSFSVLFWVRYVIEYFDFSNVAAKILNIICIIFIAAEIILLIFNSIFHYFFWLNQDGEYIPHILRYVAFAIQMILFIGVAIMTSFGMVSKRGSTKRNTTMLIFSIAMSITVLSQAIYIFYPIYSCGLLIGNCLIHVFIYEDKKEKDRVEIKNLNMQLENAMVNIKNANEAKTNFLFNMSHDIRTPMNAIVGYTNLLEKEANDPEKVIYYQQKIAKANDILLSLINNVLNIARIESGNVELDIQYAYGGDILSNLIDVYQEEIKAKNLTINYQAYIEHKHIKLDKTKVHELFANLLSNAIKYTPEGGTITVITKELEPIHEGTVRYVTTVEDNGIGMSKDFLPHLFESFSREKNSTTSGIIGTGLGMAIVKRLVDIMNGKIEVESELGKGTKFTVTLEHELSDEEFYQKQIEQNEENPQSFNDICILLVEDNDLNAEIATILLETNGFKVERAINGVDALDILNGVDSTHFDLILMDVQMPVMNGYECTRHIRLLDDKIKANIPIIAMTANAFERDRKNALDSGMNDHFAKPFEIKTLKEKINSILKKK